MTRIRPVLLGDAERIAAVSIASWRETYRDILPDTVLASFKPATLARRWRRDLAAPAAGSASYAVEAASGDIVGFASCGRQRAPALPYDGEYYALYLLQRFQRQGLGRLLIGVMSNHLAQCGMGSASLWVVRENAPARRFYETLDAVPVADKEERRGDFTLSEIAYAWPTLPLLGRS